MENSQNNQNNFNSERDQDFKVVAKSIKKETQRVRNKVREATASYIAGGLGLVVGLSWNEAIKSLIDYFYPASSGGSLFAKFFYSIVLTIIVVFVTIYIVQPPEMKK